MQKRTRKKKERRRDKQQNGGRVVSFWGKRGEKGTQTKRPLKLGKKEHSTTWNIQEHRISPVGRNSPWWWPWEKNRTKSEGQTRGKKGLTGKITIGGGNNRRG